MFAALKLSFHTPRPRSAVHPPAVLTVGGVVPLAKLSAGEGFEYYTRVIATHNANERHTTGIDDYYAEKGESPGVARRRPGRAGHHRG